MMTREEKTELRDFIASLVNKTVASAVRTAISEWLRQRDNEDTVLGRKHVIEGCAQSAAERALGLAGVRADTITRDEALLALRRLGRKPRDLRDYECRGWIHFTKGKNRNSPRTASRSEFTALVGSLIKYENAEEADRHGN